MPEVQKSENGAGLIERAIPDGFYASLLGVNQRSGVLVMLINKRDIIG
jgi:hypothetical protein